MAWSPATVTEGCVELEAAFVPRAVIAAESGAGAEGAAVARTASIPKAPSRAKNFQVLVALFGTIAKCAERARGAG